MILIGHPLISYEKIYKVESIDQLKTLPKNALCLLRYDETLILTCKEEKLKFALHVRSKKEAIIANGIGAFFIIVDEHLADKIQALAEYYLFDTKVALLLDSFDELDCAINKRVDMAIIKSAIVF